MYGGEGLKKNRGAAESKNAGRVRLQGAPVVGRFVRLQNFDSSFFCYWT